MKKHLERHKKHIRLLLYTFAGSCTVLVLSFLWSVGIFNLPPSLVYYLRFASTGVHSIPAADVVLPVKFHRQEHSLSCEIATLKIVLDYHGIEVSESELINKMPFDETTRSGDVWGDPHSGFVGNIDGKMMVDGYGVYWEPIAVVASEWKRTGIIKNGLASDLVKHISEGRPVIIWGYLGRGSPVSWKTPEGKTIRGVNGEHTRVVYGYKGSAEKPEGFLVMDPTYGPAYWETSKLIRNWDAFGRMGVVLYSQ